ncbi:MAG: hypothetical protein WCK41_04325 [Actinomycetes bacterium]
MVVFGLWTIWIAVALLIPAILLAIGTAIMYVKKVVAPRYPRD